jgi:spore photoproduct lyase
MVANRHRVSRVTSGAGIGPDFGVADVSDLDLTVECITHRFTSASKEVLLGWYRRTRLEMDESERTRKFGNFGAAKYVYPKETMAELRSWFQAAVAETLPGAPILYWT